MTGDALGPTAGWTNNVAAADIASDGDLDLLFVNSGDERSWTPVKNLSISSSSTAGSWGRRT